MNKDTIAAIATAPGEGGIAIIRLSGPESESILRQIFYPAKKEPYAWPTHMLTYGHVMDGETVIDEAMAVLMRAPRSYTREDVVEIHLHGGFTASQKVLALILHHGARLAEKGEFTRRAFLNGRIDLSQAEAVMQMISAQSEKGRQAAIRQLEGAASSFITEVSSQLLDIQAALAACIDYPEEVSDEEAIVDILPRICKLEKKLLDGCDERAARLAEEGLYVVLCGEPNVGKSSLLNALIGEEKAIVTNIPGTTRDIIEASLTIGGCLIHMTDTAGLHETDDPVEMEGVRRARKAMERADLILLVTDSSRAMTDAEEVLLRELQTKNAVVLQNKKDIAADAALPSWNALSVLSLSAKDADTLEPLKQLLYQQTVTDDRVQLLQRRHIDCAQRAAHHLHEAAVTMENEEIDLVAIDLLSAQQALCEITGENVTEALLDRVFSRFCVGK